MRADRDVVDIDTTSAAAAAEFFTHTIHDSENSSKWLKLKLRVKL